MHFRELTDRYSLDKILRSTRTGTVLRATDSRSGQAVAIKLVTVASPAELMSRAPWFEKLAATLEALRHPNLPLLLDSGFTTEGSAFLVMEMLEGRTLDTAAGPPLRLLALLYQALDGLEALARRSIGHHNLSPDNLLLIADSEPERIKILGLGSAIFRGPGPGPSETARFRAPELSEPAPGETADWHADLYSFAATSCQVLGATIAHGDTPGVQLPFALSLELDHSETLRQTLERALRRHPAERPSHQDLRDAFRLALGADVPPPLVEKPAAKTPRLVIPSQPSAAAVAASRPVPVPPPPTPATPPALAVTPAMASVASMASLPPLPPIPDLDGTGGELLPSIDDDLLNALSPALSGPGASAPMAGEPVRPASGGIVVPFQRRPGGPMSASVAEKASADKATTLRRSILLIAVALGLILAVGIAYWWVSRGAAQPPPVPAASAPLPPPPPPRRPAADVLQEAQLAFADGDDGKALDLVHTLTPADQSRLGADGCRALQSLQSTLLLSALDHLPDNLARGLKGDIGRLRFAVAAAAGQEAAIPAAVQADLARARGVVDLYAQLEAASGRDAHAEVLERFAVLERDLPNATDPLGLREHAAAAVEEEAEALARGGKYQEAAVHLEPLQRTWPARAGLKARLDGYQKFEKDEAAQETILSAIATLEHQNQIDEALDHVRSVTPTPHLAAQFDEARTRLEAALAQVDGKAPEIVLRDGYYMDYDRGRVVQLSFRISDDFKVRSVKFMARPQGGKMRQVPLAVNRAFYTVEIPAALHQNGTLDFYVVATDVSGHEGYFGTPDHPKQLKRREGFKRLL